MLPQQLGATRSALKADHCLQAPDSFVRAPLPGMRKATAVVHTAPAMGAQFTEYTAELEKDGELGPTAAQRFIFLLGGMVQAGRQRLSAGDFGYFPAGAPSQVAAEEPSRVLVIEKPYEPLGSAPAFFVGSIGDVEAKPLMGDEDVLVQALVPDIPAFDFAVNLMTFLPGASLPMVEMHVMEHGLLMLEGGGIYRLSDCWYPVLAGDFIWMAPYCPQWFGALGKLPAKYLIYKDWNRHPL